MATCDVLIRTHNNFMQLKQLQQQSTKFQHSEWQSKHFKQRLSQQLNMVTTLSVNITGKFFCDRLITVSLQDIIYSLSVMRKFHTIDESLQANALLLQIELFVEFMFQRDRNFNNKDYSVHLDRIMHIFRTNADMQCDLLIDLKIHKSDTRWKQFRVYNDQVYKLGYLIQDLLLIFEFWNTNPVICNTKEQLDINHAPSKVQMSNDQSKQQHRDDNKISQTRIVQHPKRMDSQKKNKRKYRWIKIRSVKQAKQDDCQATSFNTNTRNQYKNDIGVRDNNSINNNNATKNNAPLENEQLNNSKSSKSNAYVGIKNTFNEGVHCAALKHLKLIKEENMISENENNSVHNVQSEQIKIDKQSYINKQKEKMTDDNNNSTFVIDRKQSIVVQDEFKYSKGKIKIDSKIDDSSVETFGSEAIAYTMNKHGAGNAIGNNSINNFKVTIGNNSEIESNDYSLTETLNDIQLNDNHDHGNEIKNKSNVGVHRAELQNLKLARKNLLSVKTILIDGNENKINVINTKQIDTNDSFSCFKDDNIGTPCNIQKNVTMYTVF